MNITPYTCLTQKRDWQGISKLNNVDFSTFWTMTEFENLPLQLKNDEAVLAFTIGIVHLTANGKTIQLGKSPWLLVFTQLRVILLNASVLQNAIECKSISIKKISGIVANKTKTLGELVIVSEAGIVSVSNCVLDTIESIEKIFPQIRTIDLNEQKDPKINSLKDSTSTNKKDSQIHHTAPAKKQPVPNPFGDEFENDDRESTESIQANDAETKKINSLLASIIAILFGYIGVHDFIWGKPLFGIVKIAFIFALWRTSATGHDIAFSLINLGISLWIFADVVRIANETFQRGKLFSTISTGAKIALFVICGISSIYNLSGLLSEISDNAKKDHGGHVYQDEIINAYNQNKLSAKARFDGPRFSLIGQVDNIEKDLWGNFTITLGSHNLGYNNTNVIKSMELEFSKRQAKDILRMKKGDRFAASCIGRGENWGTYSADKCVLKHVLQTR